MFPGVEYCLVPARPSSREPNCRSHSRENIRIRERSGGSSKSIRKDVKALPMGEHVIRLERRDLDDWPAELFRKAQLQTLIISKNLLADVCTDIHRLKQLRRLELGDNRIVSVAPEISLLVHLEYLYLENNMLQTLPIEVGFLVQLKVLNLSGNPLSGKPCSTAVETLRDIWQPDSNHEGASILADRTHRVLRYLQDHMDKEKRCVLQKREAVWKRRQARQALHSAIRIADMNNLQAALNSAEAAGLSIEETRFPREALHVLQRMRSAVGRREADDAMAAIAAWEQVSNLGEGNCRTPGGGADLDKALDLLRDAKRETLALSWRRRYEASSDAASVETSTRALMEQTTDCRIQPIASMTAIHVGRRRSAAAKKTSKQLNRGVSDGEAITFDEWLKQKKCVEKQREDVMKEFARKLRLQRQLKDAAEEQVQETWSRLESCWPSLAEAGTYPIGVPCDDSHSCLAARVKPGTDLCPTEMQHNRCIVGKVWLNKDDHCENTRRWNPHEPRRQSPGRLRNLTEGFDVGPSHSPRAVRAN